jgi:N-acyl-D-aspartate/D-glutamate deacylase
MADDFDLVIRGGTIMDGNGGTPFRGDISVKDGVIAEIGIIPKARFAGLRDRGVPTPGMEADMSVIDFANLALERPQMVVDLPASGRRLLQKARGYKATVKAGQITYRDGVATGALQGRLVRSQATA